jgi:hypothetical protein
MPVGEGCRFGGNTSWRARDALRTWRFGASGREQSGVSVVLWLRFRSQANTVGGPDVSSRLGGPERTGWVHGFVQRQEGSGAGDGVQLCEGSKALKGETP